MYEITKSVILRGRFELSDMLRKLDTLWVQGDLTDQQKTELEALAREHADPTVSLTLAKRVEALEAAVEEMKKSMSGGATQPTDEWPPFEPNHVYVKGGKVTHQGKHYVCVLNEYTDRTTWSPTDYPPYWKEQK